MWTASNLGGIREKVFVLDVVLFGLGWLFLVTITSFKVHRPCGREELRLPYPTQDGSSNATFEPYSSNSKPPMCRSKA
jgi:hypothetical protein